MEEICLLIDLLFAEQPTALFEQACRLDYLTTVEHFLKFCDAEFDVVIKNISPRIFMRLSQEPNFTPLIEDVLHLAVQNDMNLDFFSNRGISRDVINVFARKNMVEGNYDVVKYYYRKYPMLFPRNYLKLAIILDRINFVELFLYPDTLDIEHVKIAIQFGSIKTAKWITEQVNIPLQSLLRIAAENGRVEFIEYLASLIPGLSNEYRQRALQFGLHRQRHSERFSIVLAFLHNSPRMLLPYSDSIIWQMYDNDMVPDQMEEPPRLLPPE